MLKILPAKLKINTLTLVLIIVATLLVGSFLGIGIRETFSGETTSNGVRKEDIPEGDEDLYILKSEIVPPVCPKCPDVKACGKPEKCPPCPACARCPEPSYKCELVPQKGGEYRGGGMELPSMPLVPLRNVATSSSQNEKDGRQNRQHISLRPLDSTTDQVTPIGNVGGGPSGVQSTQWRD